MRENNQHTTIGFLRWVILELLEEGIRARNNISGPFEKEQSSNLLFFVFVSFFFVLFVPSW